MPLFGRRATSYGSPRLHCLAFTPRPAVVALTICCCPLPLVGADLHGTGRGGEPVHSLACQRWLPGHFSGWLAEATCPLCCRPHAGRLTLLYARVFRDSAGAQSVGCSGDCHCCCCCRLVRSAQLTLLTCCAALPPTPAEARVWIPAAGGGGGPRCAHLHQPTNAGVAAKAMKH